VTTGAGRDVVVGRGALVVALGVVVGAAEFDRVTDGSGGTSGTYGLVVVEATTGRGADVSAPVEH
jgi:hypothetical protein